MVGLMFSLIKRIAWVPDPVVQAQLAALAGPFVGLVALFFSGSPLTGVPGAPYFWAVSGILVYWIGTGRAWDSSTSAYNATWARLTRSHVSGATDSRAAVPIR